MTSKPRVSIGLPVYNGENYLDAAIESILAQEFEDFELVISDNGSTDRTEEICRRYASKDLRIRYFREEQNRGAAWNYNRVFALSRGDFFKWQAHDDVCLPAMLQRCVDTFDHAPGTVVLVFPRVEIIDHDGTPMTAFKPESLDARQASASRRLSVVLRELNMACAVFGLARASALRTTRLIGPFVASDYALLAELAMLGQLWELPEILFQRRVHPKISTYANRSPRELLRWYSPSIRSRNRLLSPMMWLGIEYVRSTTRLPLEAWERLRCLGVVLSVWYPREFRNLGGRYKRRLKERLGMNTAA